MKVASALEGLKISDCAAKLDVYIELYRNRMYTCDLRVVDMYFSDASDIRVW